MWRTTKDEVWRERGWQIFLAIEANCRMPIGYASVGADRRTPEAYFPIDEMPRSDSNLFSFFLVTLTDFDCIAATPLRRRGNTCT